MKTAIQVQGGQAECNQYRRLLTSDWTEGSLDNLLDLVDAQLPDGRKLHDCTFNGTLFDPWEGASHPLFVNGVLLELLKANEDVLRTEPPARIEPPAAKSGPRWWDRLIRCLTALVLPIRFRLEGHADLFLDSVSLVFLQSIHALVPTVRSKQTSPQIDLLWHVMALHCIGCWQHNLAQQQYLLSCLFHELDEPDREVKALQNAFSLTRPDHHDFLSKAQAVWSCLVDQRRFTEAREFILQVARIAPPNAIEELSEMINDTLVPAKSA